MVVGRLLLIICVISSPCFAQETSSRCRPSAEVAQALAALPPADDPDLTWEERVGPVRSLLKRYPSDLFVQLRYQDAVLPHYWLADEFDRAVALYGGIPDSTLSKYLEARLLWRSRMRRSRETLNHLVDTVPRFPWPHLTLVEMAELPGNADSSAAEMHLGAFLKACPNALEAYDHFKNVRDPEMIRSGAAHLRQLLSKCTDAMVWHYYPKLWDLEFRAAPKEEHDKARQLVRDDVKRLQALEPVASRSWYWTFKQASELTQDPSINNWLNEITLSKFPNSQFAIDLAEEHWMQEHPRPSAAKQEDYKRWNERRFEATEEWLKRWPNAPSLVAEEWRDVRLLPGLSTEKVMTIIDKNAEIAESRPDVSVSFPPFSVRAAEEYVKRKVRLDRVPALVEAGLRQAETQQKYQLDPELIPAEVRGRLMDWLTFTHQRAGIILADVYLFTKETSKAQDVLTQVSTELEAQKPAKIASPRDQSQYQRERREFLQRLAQLEEMEGKQQDALVHYQEVLQQSPRRVVGEERED